MASNGSSNGTSSSKAHLERLEEAERRKLEMEQKRAPPSRSASAASGSASASGNRGGSRSSRRERSQRRNGTYILLLVTTLTATVGLNVAHHTITGGGAAQVSVRAAEAFLGKHFNTAMDVLETEVHQLENQLEHVWRGGTGEDEESAYDRAVRGDRADGVGAGTGGDEDASGMKPWLNKGAREISLADATDNERQIEARDDIGDNAKDGTTANAAGDGHTLAGLSCAKYGGPSDEVAKEMVYWSDIPSDSQFVSPFKKEGGGETKYMTFEPDGGGWNNIVRYIIYVLPSSPTF